MSKSYIGKVMIRIKENWTRNEQSLKMQVTRGMFPHLRSSIHLVEDEDFDLKRRIRMKARSIYIVVLVGISS